MYLSLCFCTQTIQSYILYLTLKVLQYILFNVKGGLVWILDKPSVLGQKKACVCKWWNPRTTDLPHARLLLRAFI